MKPRHWNSLTPLSSPRKWLKNILALLKYFTILAIFIACLGLFGLASFTAEQRTKEIGVRKVLGAKLNNIVGLLYAKDVLRVLERREPVVVRHLLHPVLLVPETIDLSVKAVGRTGIPWTLTLVADSDFQSGAATIPISVVSWTAAPNPPFNDGALSTTTPVLIGSGLTHDFVTVSFDFVMQNSWSYNVGNYTSTATFTLSAP